MNIYLCFIDCAKAFDYVGQNKQWKIFKQMGVLNRPPFRSSWETYTQVKKQQLELDTKQLIGSK